MRSLMMSVCLLLFAGLVAAQEVDTLPTVELLAVEVISERPHDTAAFTQGLLYHEGLLYESTGRRGQSTVREVDPHSGEVLRRFDVPDEIFAEGLALFDDRLYQLSWQAQVALVYEFAPADAAPDSFQPLGLFQYVGEGWGLCSDEDSLYMSDGSSTITIRSPESFQPISMYRVTLYGVFVDEINELECVGEHIYANIWQSDSIIRFDKTTGVVDAVIDGAGLLSAAEREAIGRDGVLNGIAYDDDNEVFYITGKLWPKLFEVRFVADEG